MLCQLDISDGALFPTLAFGYSTHSLRIFYDRCTIIRLADDGSAAVTIFFAVAGYVCSAKALRLMHDARYEQKLRTLCSSILRSALRLYLPVLVVSFTCANLGYLGAFDLVRPVFALKGKYPLREPNLRRVDFWIGQMQFWAAEMFKLTNLGNAGTIYTEHDSHFWSVPYELRMRLHLYAALLALSLCKLIARLCGLVALAALYMVWNRWEGTLLFLGASVAQLNLTWHEKTETVGISSKRTLGGRKGTTHKYLRYGLYKVSLYLMSFPIFNVKHPAPRFISINNLIPDFYTRGEKFPESIGALMLVYLLTITGDRESSWWHRVLNSKFAQYMGKIMFAVYLMHGPVLHLVGLGVPFWVWSYTGTDTALARWAGLFVCSLYLFTITLWLADIFTREGDASLARLVCWCETSFLPS